MKKALIALLLLPICFLVPVSAAELSFVTEQFPPFSFEQDGRAAGPMTDVITELCTEMKKSCEQKLLPWRRAMKGTEDGEYQGIYSVGDTPENREKFYMLPSVFKSAYAFIVPKDSSWSYTGPDSLKGQQISVYGPSSTSKTADDLIKAAGGGEAKIEISNDNVVKMLDAHHATVGLINRDVGSAIMKSNNISDLNFVGEAKAILYTIGLSRKSFSEADAESFNQAYKRLVAAGTIKKIADRYAVQAAE